MPSKRVTHRLFVFIFCILSTGAVRGDYREHVQWERLAAELGEAIPAGHEIAVSLIEARSLGNYMPNTGSFEFSDKTLNAMSGESGISNHATFVAQRFFGNATSMSPAIDTIDVYEAIDWLYDGFLNTDRPAPPATEIRRIQNHTWTGSFDTYEHNVKAVRRLDHAIARDGFIATVALRNNTEDLPALLAHSYNAISVGRWDGFHSRRGTWFDEPGRVRPDLVAWDTYSSPIVGSAAALLLEEADRTPDLVNARRNPEVIKAILMAGASKEPYPFWARTVEQPLDEIVGAGQVNVYRAYRILTGGENVPGNAAHTPLSSWSRRVIPSGESESYAFSFDRDVTSFTAHATWNRVIEPGENGDFLDAEVRLARFELRLFEADGGETGALVQASVDPVNNNQHIYIENLSAGEYVLRIDRPAGFGSFEAACALAWNAIKPPPVTYGEWQHDRFFESERNDPQISGPGADPDGDGVRNLLEYALNGNPLAPGRHVLPQHDIVTENGTAYLALTFSRPDGLEDIEYFVDASNDLAEWSEGTGVLVNSHANPDGTVTETLRDAVPLAANGQRYLRLRVEPGEPD